VQIIVQCHTGDDYDTKVMACSASLFACPIRATCAQRDRNGRCKPYRHGTYLRVEPSEIRIVRFFCRLGHITFSRLPSFLAARMPGTLAEVQTVVEKAEATSSQEAIADAVRPDIELQGALRWMRRRLLPMREALTTIKGLFPLLFSCCAPTLGDMQAALQQALHDDSRDVLTDDLRALLQITLKPTTVLVALRAIAEPHLQQLPAPLGFAHRGGPGKPRRIAIQHDPGATSAPPIR
jgi:hypothetical protein